MKEIYNISYTGTGIERHLLDLYLPDGECSGVFVYFHGGGIEKGSKNGESRRKYAEYLCPRGIAVACANYRLYPDAKYPEFIEDAAAAVAYVKRYCEEKYGSVKLYVGGSSAGGYLSMMLCYDPKYLGAHGIAPTDIAAYIHDAGQPTTHFNVCRERGLAQNRCIIDEAAPLYHVGLAKEYAPQLYIVTDNDIPARYEQTMLMIATLRHCGYDMNKVALKVMEGYTHTGYSSICDESGDSILAKMIYEYVSKL